MSSLPADTHACFASFGDVLRHRASERGDATALNWVDRTGHVAESWTFAELDHRARAVAGHLQAQGLAGERALLMFPPGLDFVATFFGCLYAGVTAIPAYPPDPSRLNRSLPRFVALVNDSNATAVLSTTMIQQLAGALIQMTPGLENLQAIVVDALPEDAADHFVDPGLRREDLAFIQYSSGSTASPKGIVVTHQNLLDHALTLQSLDDDSPGRSGLWWLPSYHDLGLIAGILQPVYYGVQTSLMSPIDFMKHPMSWLRAISELRPTHTGGPNFGYDLCVRKFDAAELEGVDLSCVTVFVNAAERIRKETLDRFVETFAPYGVRREAFGPAYGLAEATLVVSTQYDHCEPSCIEVQRQALTEGRVALADDATPGTDRQWLVGVGRPREQVAVSIVNPTALRAVQPGETGEIWVHAPSVASGYLERPEQTEETFQARLPGDSRPWLRTGDIGFVHDGELFITARLKDLVILHGRNVAPEDIEHSVEQAHPLVRPGCVAAFSVENGGKERLVVALETRSQDPEVHAVVKAAIRERLAVEDGLQVWRMQLLPPRELPKTSSGKIQRHAAQDAFIAQLQADQAGAARVRDWLVAQVSQRVNDQRAIDLQRPILSYGIDSLEGVALVGDLEKVVGCELSARLVFDNPTLEVLVARVAESRRNAGVR